jgi:uncharacterized SAM-binding protein YcdF (DUF218 family)
VLGCRLKPDGAPTQALRRRVQLAVDVYRRRIAPVLLLSGGGPRPVSEAEAMRELAVAAGVPDLAILLESGSRNTAENAFASAALLRQRGLQRVVLVTHRVHLPRARLLFRLAGLRVVGAAGVPAHSPGAALAAAVYEIAALPLALVRAASSRGG